MNTVTFVTEAGAPTIERREAERIRADLLADTSALSFRSRAAAATIQSGLSGDGRIDLPHAERLAVLEVLEKRGDSLDPELIALAAALRQAPSLTHERGRESDL